MNVALRLITQDNWIECIRLNVTEEQQQSQFVAPNTASLAQAYGEPWWTPLGIYAGDTMVGFVMHGRRPGSTINYIARIMIDARYQGRGYGRAALQAVLDRIQQEGSGPIQLHYDLVNTVARNLYTSVGFRIIAEDEHGEVLAQLTRDDP
jgi:diamine N-acetyltransferase